MELAIPFLALGGMYIVANQKKKSCNQLIDQDEGYTNMGKEENYLPNVNNQDINYPTLDQNELKNDVNRYLNPNAASDRYFNQNAYENKSYTDKELGNSIQEIYSISGEYMNSSDFKHNNMVPFNGRKVRGNTYNSNMGQTILDNMQGSGSQMIEKEERGPLFKPEDNITWTHGAPNQSDFFQSRVNPGTVANNVKPFESEMVGPGLNKGYETSGSGGFNSGMEARDKWLPPTVDEMRVATNPKLVYDLSNHEGPANSSIKNVGLMGKFEKNLPDRHFENTPDRWLTTTGQVVGPTQRAEQEQGNVKRINKPVNYTGIVASGNGEKAYVSRNYEPSKRGPSGTLDLGVANATGRGPDGSAGNINSYSNPVNNRSTMQQDTFGGTMGYAISAIMSPLMDVLKPTLKEEVIDNVRIFGDAGCSVPETYVTNPNDKTSTTIKETTLYSPTFNINNQKEGTYVNNYTPLDNTQRATTSCEYTGIADGYEQPRNYHAEYMQNNNDIKPLTINNRTNQGGTQMFNQEMNVTTQRNDYTRYDGRVNAPMNPTSSIPSVNTYGKTQLSNVESSYNTNQIDPSLLDSFRKNPFTHSLHTSV
jgi:hypothetical protein